MGIVFQVNSQVSIIATVAKNISRMKVLLTITLLLAVAMVVYSGTPLPKDFKCAGNDVQTYDWHEKDPSCKKFYYCRKNMDKQYILVGRCPNGMFYDKNTGKCTKTDTCPKEMTAEEKKAAEEKKKKEEAEKAAKEAEEKKKKEEAEKAKKEAEEKAKKEAAEKAKKEAEATNRIEIGKAQQSRLLVYLRRRHPSQSFVM